MLELMEKVKTERCSICGDSFPIATMELEKGKHVCIVCKTFHKKPQESLLKIFGEVFTPKPIYHGK